VVALNPKQSAFVEAYAGDGVEAARKAGYTGTPAVLAITASKLLRVSKVAEAIAKRRQANTKRLIASREERQEFWTLVMKDTGEEMRERLKASELLGRSEADFIERIAGADGGPLVVKVVTYGGDDA
jgi:phage terminase small subunit